MIPCDKEGKHTKAEFNFKILYALILNMLSYTDVDIIKKKL